MIATSILVMFGLMYIHTDIWDHVVFSEPRAWMALLMGAVMAIIMLGDVLNMYKSRRVTMAIFAAAALAFALTTWLVRSQVTVNGIDYGLEIYGGRMDARQMAQIGTREVSVLHRSDVRGPTEAVGHSAALTFSFVRASAARQEVIWRSSAVVHSHRP